MPSEVPLARNSTDCTVPSTSEAWATRVRAVGATNMSLVNGETRMTVGGWLITGVRRTKTRTGAELACAPRSSVALTTYVFVPGARLTKSNS